MALSEKEIREIIEALRAAKLKEAQKDGKKEKRH